MKIIQFKNGKYGIQKGIFFKKYVDLFDPEFSWKLNSHVTKPWGNSWIQTSELRQVKKVYYHLTGKYWKGVIKVINV